MRIRLLVKVYGDLAIVFGVILERVLGVDRFDDIGFLLVIGIFE